MKYQKLFFKLTALSSHFIVYYTKKKKQQFNSRKDYN